MRKETDLIGTLELPDDALYGIHAYRAKLNFPDSTIFQKEWFRAVGIVKQACFITVKKFFNAATAKFNLKNTSIRVPDQSVLNMLESVAGEIANGSYFDHFIVPAIQGGAGTSINMNINEILSNVSLIKMEERPGNYKLIDPVEHANIFQSTNDVIPTALRIAVMRLLNELETSVNGLRQVLEIKEKEGHHQLRVAYTQMQEAVPSSFGRLFSTYNDALSRDWWRVSKCFERIKMVNLGGSAIGSGITVPRFFIMEVVQVLKELTGLPVTRSENMHDATANLDSFVEVHAILKAHAVNLEKIAADLRLLSSDLHLTGEVKLPAKQTGSSIMPAKINPVIPEFIISSSHTVYCNDMLISNLAAQGCLELNAYLPVIGHKLIDSLNILIASNITLKENVISDLKINHEKALIRLFSSPAVTTALLPHIGYNKASEMAKVMHTLNIDIFQANNRLGFIDPEKITELMKPENLLKEGFSIKELL